MDGSCSGLQFKLRMASTNQQQRRKRAPFMVSVRLSRRDWKGFYYYYAGEMLPDEYRQKIRNQKKKPNKNSRPVICLETGERFESLTLASRMLGIRTSNVFNAIKNGSTAHGFHFYYGDEPKPVDSFFKPRCRRKIRCTETGVVYESVRDAAKRTKISPHCIGSAASGMAGGYHWEYADD